MESLLERLATETPAQLRDRSREALDFFRGHVRNLKISPQSFYKQTNLKKATRFLEGRMYTFFYDPKTKDKLPYYDRFPVILLLEANQQGFSGLNLHYIPPRYRVKLLNELYDFIVTDDEEDDENMKTRIRVTYEILQSTAKMKFFRPCYKRYLTSHIEGRALEIIPEYWDIMAMLPVGRFQKESVRKVYSESIRSFN
tara:strand:- start:1248 stop:1841 length:594 start_codon:yes stop_codon:yes gene_type:complete